MYCPGCDECVPERWDVTDEAFRCPACGSHTYESREAYIEVVHATARWQRNREWGPDGDGPVTDGGAPLCPACGGGRVRHKPGGLNSPREDSEWWCRDCDIYFADPERSGDEAQAPRSGLARALYDADPDVVPDGGAPIPAVGDFEHPDEDYRVRSLIPRAGEPIGVAGHQVISVECCGDSDTTAKWREYGCVYCGRVGEDVATFADTDCDRGEVPTFQEPLEHEAARSEDEPLPQWPPHGQQEPFDPDDQDLQPDGGREIVRYRVTDAGTRPWITYGPAREDDEEWTLAASVDDGGRVELTLGEAQMYHLWSEVRNVPWPAATHETETKHRLVKQVVQAANDADIETLRDMLGLPGVRER